MTHDVVDPASLGVDRGRVDALVARARREIDSGLLPSCQLAVARHGRLAALVTLGDATDDTRYVVFSATKGIVAGAVWLLIGEGKLDPAWRVVDVFAEFGTNGKDAVTIEQVLLHTSGFPRAPLGPDQWGDRATRVRRMSEWRLNWQPGTASEYHPTSAHWVLAELIERASGIDYREFIHDRLALPLGLPAMRVGVPEDEQGDIAELRLCGEPTPPEEVMALFGVPEIDRGEVSDEGLMLFNDPANRAVGVPGGGGVMGAADLALYYQALLHNPDGLWKPDVLADATGNIRNTFVDRLFRVRANRTIGLMVAGDDGLSSARGFGKTVSALAFGHNGAAGQVAWADPVSGLSFAYCTNGIDRHLLRQYRRDTAIASFAGVCAGEV
jgi:CubicO group peptidase (beta-lactamase class C family)